MREKLLGTESKSEVFSIACQFFDNRRRDGKSYLGYLRVQKKSKNLKKAGQPSKIKTISRLIFLLPAI
jgi:hypothetical protein